MNSNNKTLFYLFAIEGILYQFVIAINNLGNTIYATNIGATDTQIGLIQTIPNLIAIIFMIPIGLLATKCKSTKTIPIILLFIMGISYVGYATVPILQNNEIIWFFVFLGISMGFMGVYNAQWQLFFGSVVKEDKRNYIYSVRNQFMYFVGAIVPLVCGILMAGLWNTKDKVLVLRIFFYICAISLLLQAVIIQMVPGGKREREIIQMEKVHLNGLTTAFSCIIKDKKLRIFFASMLFFYSSWQIDWSMWYIGQVQYIGMSESQLGYFNALASIGQMLTIGFFAKRNTQKGVANTLLVTIISLVLFPIAMTGALLIPSDIRAWSFMLVCVLLSAPLGCVNLCIIQMVLNTLPEEGQAVMLSIYSLMITLSNCIVPLLGVKLYIFLGADLRAMFHFFGIVIILRIGTFLLFRKKSRPIRNAE